MSADEVETSQRLGFALTVPYIAAQPDIIISCWLHSVNSCFPMNHVFAK